MFTEIWERQKSGVNRLCKLIEEHCHLHHLRLLPQYVPGLLHVLADVLSRHRPLPGEWKLDPSDFTQICGRWGTPVVVLFASQFNRQLPVFYLSAPISSSPRRPVSPVAMGVPLCIPALQTYPPSPATNSTAPADEVHLRFPLVAPSAGVSAVNVSPERKTISSSPVSSCSVKRFKDKQSSIRPRRCYGYTQDFYRPPLTQTEDYGSCPDSL